MHPTHRIWRVIILASLGFLSLARAQQTPETLYVVTHVDLMPSYTAAGTDLLKQFASDSLKDEGVVRFEVLQEPSRLNHFTVVSVWKDRQAFETHTIAPHTRLFRDKVQPMLGSPFDERLHRLAR